MLAKFIRASNFPIVKAEKSFFKNDFRCFRATSNRIDLNNSVDYLHQIVFA
jgi:hypothetical protein